MMGINDTPNPNPKPPTLDEVQAKLTEYEKQIWELVQRVSDLETHLKTAVEYAMNRMFGDVEVSEATPDPANDIEPANDKLPPGPCPAGLPNCDKHNK